MAGKMYTKEQQEQALKEFELLGSVTAVIHKLGYPSRAALYQWYEHKKVDCLNNHGTMKFNKGSITSENSEKKHKEIASAKLKMEVLRRCFEDGEDVEYVARDIGYCRNTIYQWRKDYLKKGVVGLMPLQKRIPREKLPKKINKDISNPTVTEMQEKIKGLQLDVDILKETINILKKDPGVDMTAIKNREKVVIVDALKNKYSLSMLLAKLNFAKSSYYYQRNATRQPDKYFTFRKKIITLFHENRECYGYRRIYGKLKKTGYTLSEKVIQRLMKEENLTVWHAKKKKYSSYQGEISLGVENIISRDFHANKPNTKWLTDITEFSHPEGKVYLSALIDCFDGKVVTWTIGNNPNAKLVNTMLERAIDSLIDGECPIIHSDRGCHYRWFGWINLMKKFGLTRSMSKKGCSPDNSACEGFFGRLKNEMYYGKSWNNTSIKEFMILIDEYICWYNNKRIKVSLGFKSPVEYRKSLGISA